MASSSVVTRQPAFFNCRAVVLPQRGKPFDRVGRAMGRQIAVREPAEDVGKLDHGD
jgi:hypothetical protein